jgi:hypothetical protein
MEEPATPAQQVLKETPETLVQPVVPVALAKPVKQERRAMLVLKAFLA